MPPRGNASDGGTKDQNLSNSGRIPVRAALPSRTRSVPHQTNATPEKSCSVSAGSGVALAKSMRPVDGWARYLATGVLGSNAIRPARPAPHPRIRKTRTAKPERLPPLTVRDFEASLPFRSGLLAIFAMRCLVEAVLPYRRVGSRIGRVRISHHLPAAAIETPVTDLISVSPPGAIPSTRIDLPFLLNRQ